MSKSTLAKLDNTFLWKLHVVKINLFSLTQFNSIFRKKKYKKQAQMFYQNHSLALHTLEIFCNLILRNYSTWTWKISNFMLYLTQKMLELPQWTWFYDILELQGLIQPKSEIGHCFWGRKVWQPNSAFFARLYCQKQLRTKIFNSNCKILILKSVLKTCT